MGIKNFKRLLDKYCPWAVKQYPISILSGKKVCIDLLGLGYSLWSIAHREEVNSVNLILEDPQEEKIYKRWLIMVKHYLDRLFKHEITPIFVIDGLKSSEKDKFTGTKRKKSKISRKERVEKIKETIKKVGVLSVTGKMEIELKKAHMANSRFTSEIITRFMDLIRALGLPLLTSQGLTGEADKLCSFLCKNGYVQGVISQDRDLLVFGSPYIITKNLGYKYNKYIEKSEFHVEAIVLDEILKATGLTHAQFVDVCVLAGCDYNEKLPGHSIVTICELIKRYGKIENLPPKYKIGCTNFVTARKFFAQTETYSQLCEIPDHRLEINFSVLKDIEKRLKPFELDSWSQNLKNCYSFIQKHDKIVPIKTKNGIIRLKIKSNRNDSVSSRDDYVDSKKDQLDLDSFKDYIKI